VPPPGEGEPALAGGEIRALPPPPRDAEPRDAGDDDV
jgi:hypothetical protein